MGEKFEYSYSAKEREEIERIRQKYLPQEEDKLAQLRRLDASATKNATIASLVVGIVGTLLLGVGMSCAMVWADKLFAVGIVVGLIGLALIGAALPLYNRIVKKCREKIAPEVLRLTDELSQ